MLCMPTYALPMFKCESLRKALLQNALTTAIYKRFETMRYIMIIQVYEIVGIAMIGM